MPHSLHPRYVANLHFDTVHLAQLARLGEHLGHQALYVAQRPEQLEHLRHAAMVASTVSSNRLEGIEVAPERVQGLMRGTPDPRTRHESEVAGYREVLELVHESFEHMDMRPNLILQLHKMLYRYHPAQGGRYKAQDNTIIETLPTGETRVRFEPTSALATPGAMETLCRRYQEAQRTQHALVVIPLMILDFLCIHPFADGNGRLSRLLTLLELHRASYTVGRYISVERVIEQSKQGYYEALEASSKGWHDGEHDALPWLGYFWGMLEAVYGEFEGRVQEILAAGKGKASMVRLVVSHMTEAFRVGDIATRLPHISKATIHRTLKLMQEEDLVELEGEGRTATWHVKNTPPFSTS